MLISVIAPAYNEEKTIIKILDKVKNVKLQKEILIVDDGSTDKTPRLLKKFLASNKNVKLFTHQKNLGKGAAVQTALAHARGKIVIIQDTDLEYDPSDYKKLIQPFLENKAKVVYGSRILGNNRNSNFIFYLGGRSLTFITNVLYGSKITDQPTGYKVFEIEVLKNINLEAKGFAFCSEVTAKLLKKGHEIIEVPISYIPRPTHEKKINLKDWFEATFTLIYHRLF